MQRQILYHLNFVLLTGTFLATVCPAEAQVQPASYAVGNQYGVWNGYGCPCPSCMACKKDYALNDLIHGFQAQPWVQWLIDDNYYSRSPDHGFARVTKVPIQRQYSTYTRYWPTNWYGSAAARQIPRYPTVGVPTDTTHLGYYYQHAPQWQPRPGMIPPPPTPSLFHTRGVKTKKSGKHRQAMWDQSNRAVMCKPTVGGNGVPPAPAADSAVPPAPASQPEGKSAAAPPPVQAAYR